MFDLDGTLLDTLPPIVNSVDRAMMEQGFSAPGLEKAKLWVGNGSKLLLLRALADAVELPSLEADFHAQMMSTEQQRQLDSLHQAFMDAYGSDAKLPARPFVGVVETLAYLKRQQIPMACVTNKPFQFVDSVLQAADIDQYFNYSIGGDSLPNKKPAPDLLLATMDHFDCKPESALMVGDSDNDFLAAKSAGVDSIGVDYGYNHGCPVREESDPQKRAGVIVSDLREFFLPDFSPKL